MQRLLALAMLAGAAACGGDPAQVSLVPRFGQCGKPTGGLTLRVKPLGPLTAGTIAIAAGAPVALAELPAGTEQLSVEVLGAAGAILAEGKTAPFVADALADGAELAIAMAPPDGFCEVDPMTAARTRPLLVRAGAGVLVAGGYGPGGAPLASAEYYDPARDGFTPVTLPAGFVTVRGLAGASLVALPDGRAALVGGPSPGYAIYDPATGFPSSAVLVTQVRAHAAAVALDATRVLLAGGCSQLDDLGRCVSAARDDTTVLDLGSGQFSPGPALAAPRVGGQAFLEVDGDGTRRVVVTGGVDGAGAPITTSERLALDGGPPVVIAGTGAAAARLDSGALITAFAPTGAAAVGTSAAVVPGVEVARPLAATVARSGVTLVTQEDGQLLALGGDEPLRLQPVSGTWRRVSPGGAAPALAGGGHGAIVLADGSVLVVGGEEGGAPRARAWRFRPPLLGPRASAVTVVPGGDPAALLAPLDPAQIEAAPWALRGAGARDSWVVVGGPVGDELQVALTAVVPPEGLAVLFGFVDGATHHRALLVPGSAAAIERRGVGGAAIVCRGQAAPATGRQTITLELGGQSVRLAAGGQVLLRCDTPDLVRGRVGVAAIGTGAVRIETIAVTR